MSMHGDNRREHLAEYAALFRPTQMPRIRGR